MYQVGLIMSSLLYKCCMLVDIINKPIHIMYDNYVCNSYSMEASDVRVIMVRGEESR